MVFMCGVRYLRERRRNLDNAQFPIRYDSLRHAPIRKLLSFQTEKGRIWADLIGEHRLVT